MIGGIDTIHRELPTILIPLRTVTHVLHSEIVFRAANDLELFQKLSYKVLQVIEQEQPFDGNPLYAILHEPIYCQGWAISLLVL